MKELLTPGKATESGVHKRPSIESYIVDTMHRYFENDKGKMGNMELSIMESVRRYFEEPPSKRIA